MAVLLALLVGLAAAGAAAGAAGQPAEEMIFLTPRGYTYPAVEFPGQASPGACIGCGGNGEALTFQATKNLVTHRLPLDHSAEKWTDSLLTIEVGTEEPWSPEQCYGIFPGAIKGYEEKFLIFHARALLVFDFLGDADAEPQALRALNDPRYVLRREGDSLMLTFKADRRWYYESVHFGKTWRLAKMGFVKWPDRLVELEYEGDKIAAVRYPDGRKATLAYRNGFVSEVRTPGGEVTRLARDGSGYVVGVEIARPNAEKKETVTRQFLYESTAEGRLTRFIDEGGAEYRLEYSEAKLGDDMLYTAVIRNAADGSYRFRRQTARQGSDWRVEDGAGGAGTPLSAAVVTGVREYSKINYAYRVAAEAFGALAHQSTNLHDAHGNVVKTVDALGRETASYYDDGGNAVAVKRPDGSTAREEFNAFGQKTISDDGSGREAAWDYDDRGRLTRLRTRSGSEAVYTYDERGDLRSTGLGDMLHTFRTDALGRIVEHRRPDGSTLVWVYDEFGRIVSEIFQGADAAAGAAGGGPGSSQVQSVTRFRYDDRDRPVRMLHPDGGEESFKYDCCRLIECVDRLGRKTSYRYDNRGRVTAWNRDDGAAERFVYDARGRRTLEARRTRKGEDWAVQRQAYDDGDSRAAPPAPAGTPPAARVFRDKAGRTYRFVNPDGSYGAYTMDAMDRTTSMRGRGGVVFNQYNERGELVAEVRFPAEEPDRIEVTRYEYDAAGNRTAIAYPDGRREAHEFDSQSRKTASRDFGGVYHRYVYDKLGQLAEIHSGPTPDGLVLEERRTYTPRGREFDVYRRRPETGRPGTDKSGFYLAEHHVYSARGDLLETIRYRADGKVEARDVR